MQILKLGKDLKNRLTDYSLACGYIEKNNKEGVETTLYKEAGCKVYQVRQHNFNTGMRVFWNTFDSRCKAYNFYFIAIK